MIENEKSQKRQSLSKVYGPITEKILSEVIAIEDGAIYEGSIKRMKTQ